MRRIKKLFLMVLFLITAFNVYISQAYSPHVYRILIDKNPVSSLSLLEKLHGSKNYPQQLQFLSSYIGIDFKQHFNSIEIRERNKIHDLEGVMAENPNQPQILFMLSQKYKKLGDNKRAEEYSKQAHVLDPLNY